MAENQSNLIDGVVSPENEADQVAGYFQDVRNYVAFDLTADAKQLMIGCIDPRCECRRSLRNKVQTPGAAYGIANDRQLAHMVMTGNFINVRQALGDDATQRNTSTLDVHHDCKFWKFRQVINEEIAEPSAQTYEALENWRRKIYNKDRLDDGLFEELRDASRELATTMNPGEQPEDEDLIEFIRGLDPTHKNVHRMEGFNHANAYVINHLTGVGQDKKNLQEETQAYFDGLGAIIHDIKNPGNDFKKGMLPKLVGAALMRSAATRTIISADSNLVQLETRRKHKRIEITRLEEAA